MKRVAFLVLLTIMVNILFPGLTYGENGESASTTNPHDSPSIISVSPLPPEINLIGEDNFPNEQGFDGTTIANLRFFMRNTVYYVGEQSNLMDTAPIIRENRIFLPIRFLAKALGAEVGWDPTERKTTITRNNDVIEMWIDNPNGRVNGEFQTIDPQNPKVKPFIIPPGRTVLPLRFIFENLGFGVDWNQDKQEVTVLYPEIQVSPEHVSQLLSYIKEYDEKTKTLIYDEIEWVCHTNTSRVLELGLDINQDFPNGFYIYNESEDFISIKVSPQVKVFLVNWEDLEKPLLTDMEGFLKRTEEYEAPYRLSIKDGIIIEIVEQYIP